MTGLSTPYVIGPVASPVRRNVAFVASRDWMSATPAGTGSSGRASMRRRRSEIAPAIIQRPRSSTPLASSRRTLEAAGQRAVAVVCGKAATTSGSEDNAVVGDCSGRGAAAGTHVWQIGSISTTRRTVRQYASRARGDWSRQTSTTSAAADTTTAVWRPKSQRSRSHRLLVIASSPSCGRCRGGRTPRDGLPRAGAARAAGRIR